MEVSSTSEQDINKTQLDQLLTTIEANCANEETGGVLPFKESNLNDTERAANNVFDGLMTTLAYVGSDAYGAALKGSQEYAEVLKAVDYMAHVCRLLADDNIPLIRGTKFEERRKAVGDNVYRYLVALPRDNSGNEQPITLDGRTYSDIHVLIRPRAWRRGLSTSADVDTNRPHMIRPESLEENRQARMNIEITPKDGAHIISLRIDQEDANGNFEVIYDIDIGGSEQGKGGKSDLISQAGLKFPNADQLEGHHFSSKITSQELNNLNTNFANMLEAYNAKFSSHVATN